MRYGEFRQLGYCTGFGGCHDAAANSVPITLRHAARVYLLSDYPGHRKCCTNCIANTSITRHRVHDSVRKALCKNAQECSSNATDSRFDLCSAEY